jgi:VanZ family protein
VVLAAAVAGQCLALYLPGQPTPASPLALDKAGHFLMFAAVATVAVWAGVPWPGVLVFLILQAGVSEVVQQTLLPDRGAELGDLFADLAGAAAGILLGRWWLSRRRSQQGSGYRPWQLPR